MNKIEIFKALSNETRLSILEWLKEPEKNFPPQGTHFDKPIDLKGGVCVGSITNPCSFSKLTSSVRKSAELDVKRQIVCYSLADSLLFYD